MMAKYAGADWVQSNICGKDKPMSKLGREAADLLGQVYQGIYHLDSGLLARTNWQESLCVAVTVRDGMATWDGNKLTALVVLAHDRLLRVEIEASTHGYLRIWISKRKGRGGSTYERHPTMEQAVEMIRMAYAVPEESLHVGESELA